MIFSKKVTKGPQRSNFYIFNCCVFYIGGYDELVRSWGIDYEKDLTGLYAQTTHHLECDAEK